jgi:hypothetical protein
MLRYFPRLLGIGLCFGSLLSGRAQTVDSNSIELFEKRIRPLLAERCYACHGPKLQWGGLRVDSLAGLLKGGSRGPALVPGKPEESLLIQALSYEQPELKMPPTGRLPDQDLAALSDWIRRGAAVPVVEAEARAGIDIEEGRKHWAYGLPRKVPPPFIKDTTWPRTYIDRFILAKLEENAIKPVAGADRPTLLRRAYFDLIGLPPAPDKIDSFVRDKRPDAFARVVDELLASRHFGERWARHWLDVARFAESVTLRGFIFKEAWRYRDYVIEAFNGDYPYDRFVKEQIAGDLLPYDSVDDRRRGLVATTFLALGNTNLEEQDKKQLEMDVVDEQLDTIGKAILAQTIGCARCHDHKFDPIPTRDYYAMAGILRNARALEHANVSKWIERALPLPPDQEEILRKHEADIAALEAEIKSAKEKGGKSASGHVKPGIVDPMDLPGIVIDSAQAKAVGEWKLSQNPKHYIGDGFVHDLNTGKGEKTLTFNPEITRAGRYEVRLAYVHAPNQATNAPVTVFHAGGETTIHVNQQEPPVIDGRFVSLGQFRFEGNGFGYAIVSTEGTNGAVNVDAVQFIPVEAPAGSTATAAKTEGDRASPATNDIKLLETRLKKLADEGPKRPMAMSVQEEKEFADTHVHIRGSVHSLAERVPRGFLQVATHGAPPPIPANESGRRQLGEWLAAPDNPLPARVMANRVWHWLFGNGIVRTTDNFGTTGEQPSHPELLDYLALRLMEQGWSLKKLIREIMLSRAYQLSSKSHGRNLGEEVDPENRLLWRMNRRRLEAECIRDTILTVSEDLRLDAGGSTIPPGTPADYGYKHTDTRRSVYMPVFRNALPELFELFDFPEPSMVTGRRNVSTVAPQALFLMNHPFVLEAARSAAERLLARPGLDDRARVKHLYRRTLGRFPSEGELQVSLKYVVQASAAERLEAWAQVYQSVFASIDFRYLN